jgi:hypothetical protein
LTLHFGLGGAAGADRLSVRWPSGKRQRFESLPANRRLLIVENAGVPLSHVGEGPGVREMGSTQ